MYSAVCRWCHTAYAWMFYSKENNVTVIEKVENEEPPTHQPNVSDSHFFGSRKKSAILNQAEISIEDKLKTLSESGFTDTELNRKLLAMYDGDIVKVVKAHLGC